jgi:hypothetical protein
MVIGENVLPSSHLTSLGILQESPSLNPFVKRDRARNAIIGVGADYMKTALGCEAFKVLLLRLNRALLTLFNGTHAEVDPLVTTLRTVTFCARHLCLLSRGTDAPRGSF